MKLWIKNPTAAWTANEEDAFRGVVVEGSRIVELVTGDAPANGFNQSFDASGCVLLPGLINCHHHFFQTLTRAFPAALNKELFDWLLSLYPVWANLDSEAIENASRVAMCELMLSGCTTTVDHHYMFSEATACAIDVQVKVAQELGMRAVLTRGSMSLSEKDGGLPPASVVQTPEAIMTDSERVIDTWHQDADGAMIQIALAPCSPFSVTAELMRESADLARSRNVLLHTHLAETRDENDFCLRHFEMRPLDYLEQVDWLDSDVWLAHGIHFNETEIERLGNAEVAISHCPSSNMVLASGLCPVKDLEKAEAPVGLGVDGSASNDASNMMQEVRQAFLLQRLRYGATHVSHEDALSWGTKGGARLLRRDDVGELAIGRQADIALFDLEELRFSGSGDPLAALVLGGAHRVKHLMIAGEWKVRDGELLDIDQAELTAKQQTIARRLAASI